MDARWWPIREEDLLTIHNHCESSKSMEGDCGRDNVRQCRLLTSFQEGPHQKLFLKYFFKNLQAKVANWIIVDILNYLC